MGHGKETPRQKMIGMMYLFLTCLLALNVSKSVLDAFININDRMGDTNRNFVKKNDMVYTQLGKAAALNPDKAGNANKLANDIKIKADSLVSLMQVYKYQIIRTADKLPDTTTVLQDDEGKWKPLEQMVNSKDNADVPAQIMYGQENNGEAKKVLKPAIISFREYVLSKIDSSRAPALVRNVEESLSTADPKSKEGQKASWESHNFEHLPLMAVITILTQMQASVRNVEGEVISYLYNSLGADDVKVNKLAATVIPNSSYVMMGSEYKAKMFLAAFDSTKPPIVEIGKVDSTKMKDGSWRYFVKGGRTLDVDSSLGMALLNTKPTSTGEKSYEGVIKIVKGEGDTAVYRIPKQTYQVAQASLVVSPTKMNVFYVGVDNPVDISVPGIASSKLVPSISQGSIRRGSKGGYLVKVRRPGKAKISVSAKLSTGTKSMGAKDFRVKKVPDPVAKVAGVKGGAIPHSRLQAANRVDAVMENFDFDLRFNITSFVVSTKTRDGYVIDKPASGSRITSEQKALIRGARKGQKIYFEDIKSKGPDGSIRNLGTLMFKIK